MAVLPDDSSHAVPKAVRWLMGDPESPIIDFYPKDVLCDPNGKDKKLDDYSKNVVDNVRLHENGWKDRCYTDKWKADDVEENGGR